MNLPVRASALVDRVKHDPVGASLVSLAGDSAVYLVGGLLVGLGSVVLVPLYTRTLAPRQFGIYALLDVTILLAVTASALKMDIAYLKWFAGLDGARRRELFSSTILAGLVTSTLIGTIMSIIVASRIGSLW